MESSVTARRRGSSKRGTKWKRQVRNLGLASRNPRDIGKSNAAPQRRVAAEKPALPFDCDLCNGAGYLPFVYVSTVGSPSVATAVACCTCALGHYYLCRDRVYSNHAKSYVDLDEELRHPDPQAMTDVLQFNRTREMLLLKDMGQPYFDVDKKHWVYPEGHEPPVALNGTSTYRENLRRVKESLEADERLKAKPATPKPRPLEDEDLPI